MLRGRDDALVRIGADNSGLDRAFADSRKASAKAKAALTRDARSIQSGIGRAMGNAAKSLVSFRTATVALAGVAGIAALTKRAVEFADEIGKTAKQVGVTAEALQELRFAARRSGVEVEQFDDSMRIFARRLGEVQTGTGEAKDAFEQLGISINQISGQSPDQTLELVAGAFANIEDAGTRASIAADLFGRSGVKLIPLLMEGADGIEALRQRARELGLVIEGDVIAKAEVLNDKMSDLEQQLKIGTTRALLNLMPLLEEMTDFFSELIPKVALGAEALANFLGIADSPRIELAREIEDITEQITRLQEQIASGEPQRGGRGLITATVDEMEADLVRLEALRADLLEQWEAIMNPPAPDGPVIDADDLIDPDAASEAEQLAERLNKAIADSTFELNLLAQGWPAMGEAATRALRQIGALSEELTFPPELTDQVRQLADNLLEIERHKEAAEVIQQTRTATEIYADEVERLNSLLPVLVQITGDQAEAQEILNRALDKARDRLERQSDTVDEVTAQAETQADAAASAAQGLESAFGSAFESAIAGGSELSDVLDGLAQDLKRLATRLVFQLLLGAIFPGGFALGGLLALEKGGAIDKGNILPFGKGAAIDRGHVERFAGGGVVTKPTLFPMAKGTGLMGEAGPEGILPLTRVGGDLGVRAEMAQPTVTNEITVINNSDSQVEVRDRPDGLGIEIVIDEMMANAARPGSRFARALRNNFGINHNTVSRG